MLIFGPVSLKFIFRFFDIYRKYLQSRSAPDKVVFSQSHNMTPILSCFKFTLILLVLIYLKKNTLCYCVLFSPMSDFSFQNFQIFNNGLEWKSDYVKKSNFCQRIFLNRVCDFCFLHKNPRDDFYLTYKYVIRNMVQQKYSCDCWPVDFVNNSSFDRKLLTRWFWCNRCDITFEIVPSGSMSDVRKKFLTMSRKEPFPSCQNLSTELFHICGIFCNNKIFLKIRL